jgi:DNA repair exonuclease SbcCD nuclease subunit
MTTSNLFERAMVFTDCHFGLRHNSIEHNQDIIDFLNWKISIAKARGAETCIFMGDYHHHRNSVNAQTQDFMIQGMQLLNDNFVKTYFLVGNHDLYFRENRSITTAKFATLFPNIILVDEPIVKGDVALVPWLVEDEWKDVMNVETKYLFGHLELPGFKMNAMVEMPDHGALHPDHFKHQDYVFSGHFHKRQTKGKINYIGNPFGHNYSDVWDFERGAMYLEWDKEPEFIDYTDGPRFITINLAALLEHPEIYLKPKTYLQVTLDVEITYEEATFLRETFLAEYNVREFKLVRNQNDELEKDYSGDITFKTVDQIVIEQLTNIDSDAFDSKKLIEIYNRL